MRLTNKPRGKAKAGGKGQPERIVPEVLEKKRRNGSVGTYKPDGWEKNHFWGDQH